MWDLGETLRGLRDPRMPKGNQALREVCSGLVLAWILPWDALQSCKISLTLGNNRISEMSLSNGPVSMMLQKPETSNQTNDSLE